METSPSALQLERELWFGPHAIRKEVERLVVTDHHKAAVGWTWQEIKDSFVKRHQEPPEQALFNAALLLELDWLLEIGDLKVVGGQRASGYHYTLSLPYLMAWFHPERVLNAVKVLDGRNLALGGSTLELIWGYLKPSYYPRQKPLPPDMDTMLRTILSVLHQKGHLTIKRGANNGDPRRYTLQEAPAPDEADPIDIPGYVWCYYLGFKLGAGGGFDDSSDSDKEEDASSLTENNNRNNAQTPWFGPRTVLREIEKLFVRRPKNAAPGWTSEQIGYSVSLMRTHPQQQQEGFDFDATLQATLSTLKQRGYLITFTTMEGQSGYTLSNSPPSFPACFRPEVVLQAVGELDKGNPARGGSTWQDIRRYFIQTTIHDAHSQPPWLHSLLLQTILSVLSQRGHLVLTKQGASGPEYYTRRGTQAATGSIPDDLICYYVGYKLGRGRCLDDDMDLIEAGDNVVVGLRRRNVSANNPRNDTEPLLPPPSRSSARGERTNGEANHIKEKRKQLRMWYMIWRVCLSFIGHGILFGVSFLPGFGQGKTYIKWLLWAVMNIIVPSLLFYVMIIIQIVVIDLDLEEDTSQQTPEDKKRMKTNKIVNLVVLAGSKLCYVAIKEAPGSKHRLLIAAHAIAFVIDMVGAIYLWMKHSCLDQEMVESTWKNE